MRFDSYHPAMNLIYFTAVLVMTVSFEHPVYLLISYVAAFLYSVKLNGRKVFWLNLGLTFLILFYAGYYASYHHFGITNLKSNFIGNQITLEALVYGAVTGCKLVSVLMWCSCIFTILSTDKIVYLFGRISPKLSLFLSILFRSLPRIVLRAKKIEIAREGVGKGVKQGNVYQRLLHGVGVISILITWTLEDFLESAASMKSRGYSLKGRSAFSIYRFDNRDRGLIITMMACLTLLGMAVLFDQTRIYYNPVIVWNMITPLSVVFYVVYAFFLLLPMGLEVVGELLFTGN